MIGIVVRRSKYSRRGSNHGGGVEWCGRVDHHTTKEHKTKQRCSNCLRNIFRQNNRNQVIVD